MKLDEEFEVGEAQQSSLDIQEEETVQNNNEDQFLHATENNSFEKETNIESSVDKSLFELDSIEQSPLNEELDPLGEEEFTPKLFSEESSLNENNTLSSKSSELEQKLFDQENNQEEDFEIPAFLRRQKF